jgi:hypothetical protein
MVLQRWQRIGPMTLAAAAVAFFHLIAAIVEVLLWDMRGTVEPMRRKHSG